MNIMGIGTYSMGLGLLELILLVGLVISYKKDKSGEFTLFFILFVSFIVNSITANLLPVVLAFIGLVIAHHSVQPLFYPVAVKTEGGERYITSHHHKYSFPPFKEGSDPKKEKPKFDYYLHNAEVFVIKLPLFPVFKTININFPGTHGISVEGGLTKYSVVPFIDAPSADGNSIKLRVRVSAWTITEVRYPVTFTQKLEEEPKMGIAWSVSYYYPYTEEDIESYRPLDYKPINKADEYGVLFDAFNQESVPVKYYEGVGKVSIDSKAWEKFGKEHVQVTFPNGDIVGLFKGHIYCRISDIINPMERRHYYISSKGEGKLVKFNW